MLFDKGSYSENNTFSISELFSHLSNDVLSANFGCDKKEFAHIPDREVYIVDGGDLGNIESQTIDSPMGKVPNTFKHELINDMMGEQLKYWNTLIFLHVILFLQH